MTVDTEIKAELAEILQKQMKTQIAVQAVVQIVIQDIAYGTMLVFLWRLDRTAHQVLEAVQSLPSDALESLPRGFGF